MAVTAFTGEMLRESGVRDMFELSSIAPSLSVEQTQTSSNTTFGIRGIFTSSQNFGLEPSVGLYVDGVYRSRQGSMINNMVDVAPVSKYSAAHRVHFLAATPPPVPSLSIASHRTLRARAIWRAVLGITASSILVAPSP